VKPSARADGAAAIASKAQAATATGKTRVRAQMRNNKPKNRRTGFMIASPHLSHRLVDLIPDAQTWREPFFPIR
jgi:hypothetical protein